MNRAAAFFLGFAAGFVAGRAGHVMFGPYPGLHHWMWGVVVVAIGIFTGSFAAIGFGFGLMVSDMDDMVAMRTDRPSPADLTEPRNWIGTD